jgi:hypothetical protein
LCVVHNQGDLHAVIECELAEDRRYLVLTVTTPRWRSAAIDALDLPFAATSTISRSRADNASSGRRPSLGVAVVREPVDQPRVGVFAVQLAQLASPAVLGTGPAARGLLRSISASR